MGEPQKTRVLVAGASGHLGRSVVAELARHGYRVRAVIRDPGKRDLVPGADEVVSCDLLDPGNRLGPALDGVDIVFSAAGQPCTMRPLPDRQSFAETDTPMNQALLDASLRTGVQHFAYVAVLNGPKLRHLTYVDAHEEFVDELVASEIDHTIIRANGIFSSYLDLLEVARRGLALVFGDGLAVSNPIHEEDLAAACVNALMEGRPEVDIGGPQALTRRSEIEIAFAAVLRRPRIIRLPQPLLRAAVAIVGRHDRRRAEMLDFIADISRADLLGPSHGKRTLRDYLLENATRSRALRPV